MRGFRFAENFAGIGDCREKLTTKPTLPEDNCKLRFARQWCEYLKESGMVGGMKGERWHGI